MDKLRLAFAWRYLPLTLCVLAAPFFFVAAMAAPIFGGMFKLLALVFAALAILGVRDLLQTRHSILRTHPIAGHLRFLLEEVRPEIRQYFFEDEKSGAPFSRDKRALVYQRAKGELDKRPFGTINQRHLQRQHALAHRRLVRLLRQCCLGVKRQREHWRQTRCRPCGRRIRREIGKVRILEVGAGCPGAGVN